MANKDPIWCGTPCILQIFFNVVFLLHSFLALNVCIYVSKTLYKTQIICPIFYFRITTKTLTDERCLKKTWALLQWKSRVSNRSVCNNSTKYINDYVAKYLNLMQRLYWYEKKYFVGSKISKIQILRIIALNATVCCTPIAVISH